MAVQNSVALRNARVGVYETVIGTSPILQIRTGAPPANCAAANTGTLLASMTLPSDWLTAPDAGGVAKNGTWEDSSADATGTAGHYRIFDSTGTTCHEQGTVAQTGATPAGDATINNASVVAGQPVTMTVFSKTAGNA